MKTPRILSTLALTLALTLAGSSLSLGASTDNPDPFGDFVDLTHEFNATEAQMWEDTEELTVSESKPFIIDFIMQAVNTRTTSEGLTVEPCWAEAHNIFNRYVDDGIVAMGLYLAYMSTVVQETTAPSPEAVSFIFGRVSAQVDQYYEARVEAIAKCSVREGDSSEG